MRRGGGERSAHTLGGRPAPPPSHNLGCGGGRGRGGRRQRACGPLRPKSVRLCSVFICSPPRTACVRTRACLGAGWGPRRAGARFCFRGSRTMSLWPAAGVCGMRCLWCAVASLGCHPCSLLCRFLGGWRSAMSANPATGSSSWTAGLCSQNPPITAELMPPMRWIWVCMRYRMGGGTTPANTSASMAAWRRAAAPAAPSSPLLLHCLGRAAFCPCIPV
jgi:hypothetical protein